MCFFLYNSQLGSTIWSSHSFGQKVLWRWHYFSSCNGKKKHGLTYSEILKLCFFQSYSPQLKIQILVNIYNKKTEMIFKDVSAHVNQCNLWTSTKQATTDTTIDPTAETTTQQQIYSQHQLQQVFFFWIQYLKTKMIFEYISTQLN